MVKKFTVLANTSAAAGRPILYPVRRGEIKHGIELAETIPMCPGLPFESEPQMIGSVYVRGEMTPAVAYIYDNHLISMYELLTNGEDLLVGDELGTLKPRNIGEQISAEHARMSLFGQLQIKGRPAFLDGFLCDGLDSYLSDLGFNDATIANYYQHQVDSKGVSFTLTPIPQRFVEESRRAP
jgi:hypothetical protein